MAAILLIIAILLLGVAAFLAAPTRHLQAFYAALALALAAFGWSILSTLGD